MSGRHFLLAVLLAFATILVLGVVVELSAGEDRGVALDDRSDMPVTVTAPVHRILARAVRPEFSALISQILARPLFAPNRKPPAIAVVSRAGALHLAPTTIPRLTGIVIDKGTRVAIFRSGDSPRPLEIAVGGTIGDAKIEAIGPSEVTVRGPSGKWHLRPTPDPRIEPPHQQLGGH
jgi:hypothetical protein